MALIKILFFLIPATLFAQNYPDEKIDSLLRNGIDLIINQHYDRAERNFKNLELDYAGLPLGKIYLAGVHIAKSVDYATEFQDEIITEYLDSSVDMCDSLLDTDEYNIWNNYFMALSLGYYAYYRALDGNYFLALAEGVASIEYFDRCTQIDSTFAEAFIAIGTFSYWRSVKTEFLNWLPFVKDERELGLNLLQKSISSDSYNSYLAIYSLIWIYINENQYQKAVDIAKNVLRKYPNSRYFKWGLARAFEDIDEFKAIDVYKEILFEIQNRKLNNFFNEIVLRHKIAMQYEKLGEIKLALLECDNILNISGIPEEITDRLGNRLERVVEMKERLSIKR